MSLHILWKQASFKQVLFSPSLITNKTCQEPLGMSIKCQGCRGLPGDASDTFGSADTLLLAEFQALVAGACCDSSSIAVYGIGMTDLQHWKSSKCVDGLDQRLC